MRTVKINGYIVDIDENEVIEFERKSSLLEFDNLVGGFSLTFKVPYKYSPKNRIVFHFSGEGSRKARGIVSLPFEFWWKGDLRYVGIVEATLVGEEVECSATVENGGLTEAAKAMYLDEMDLGNFDLSTPVAYFDGDIVIPKTMNLTSTLVNYTYMNVWDGVDYNQVGPTPLEHSRICPMWRWSALLEKVLGVLGYSVEESAVPDWAVLVNFRDVREYSALIPSTIAANRFVPHITVADFILQTQNLFNVLVWPRGVRVWVLWRGLVPGYNATVPVRFRDIELNLERETWTYGFTVEGTDKAYTSAANSLAGHDFLPWADVFADKVKYFNILAANGQSGEEFLQDYGIIADVVADIQHQFFQMSENGDFSLISQTGGQQVSFSWPTGLFNTATNFQMVVGQRCIRSKVLPVGYQASMLDFRQQMAVAHAGKRYRPDTFVDLRFGRLVDNGTQHEVRAIEDYSANPSTGWVLWPPSGLELNSLWSDWWIGLLNWLNENAEEFTATLAVNSPEFFVNTYNPLTVYETEEGLRVVITELTEAYSGKEMGDVKVKGFTIR